MPALQAAQEKGLTKRVWMTLLQDVLSDAFRSGSPGKFSAEQLAQVIAVACEPTAESNRPISHWTRREVADQVIKHKIVTSISTRTVGRLWTEADLKPHLSRYWLNANPDDPVVFESEVQAVCSLYLQARVLYSAGIHLVSTDEKTGIQALERKYPTKEMKPGLVERREFEYIRHGTRCLTVNFEVATGRIFVPAIGPTRTEADFADHIKRTVATDPNAEWIFIVNQFNTHQSKSLVRWVPGKRVQSGACRSYRC